jgi:hypothetical protein
MRNRAMDVTADRAIHEATVVECLGPVLCERQRQESLAAATAYVWGGLSKQANRHCTTSAGHGRDWDESVQRMIKLIGLQQS